MIATLRPALVLFALLSLLCGVIYPFAVTGIGQLVFPFEAAGSLVRGSAKDQIIGSSLIGQSFTAPNYFWGRPSATTPMANNGAGSGGSNLGPSNPAQIDAVKSRMQALKLADSGNGAAVPVDLVTASASGLDPDISPQAALYQAPRIARMRKLTLAQVQLIIAQHQQAQLFGFFGEARVNVLALNLALDASHDYDK